MTITVRTVGLPALAYAEDVARLLFTSTSTSTRPQPQPPTTRQAATR